VTRTQISDMFRRMKRKFALIALFFLILIGGGYLRFEGLNRQPYWMDEGYTINAVISGMQNGTDHFAEVLDSGSHYLCPLYCEPTKWIVRTLGMQPFSFRFFAAFAGTVFILFSYFFVRRFFRDGRIAFASTVLISFSYWQIAWSKQARWYTLTELLCWIALYFLFIAIQEKTKKTNALAAITLALLFCILATIGHPLAIGLLPAGLLIYFFANPNTLRNNHIWISGGIVLVAVFLIEYGLGIHVLSEQLKRISFHNNIFHYGSFILKNYWTLICLGIYGFARSNKEIKKTSGLLTIPFVLYFIFLSFFYENIEYRYLFYTTPVFYYIASIGIVRIYEDIKNANKDIRKLFVPATFATLIPLLVISNGLNFKPQPFYLLESDDMATVQDYYAYTPQPNWNQAYAVIKRDIQPGEIVISSHPHFNKIFLNTTGYWIAFDYLGNNEPVSKELMAERYVGASVIHDIDELRRVMNTNHGFIVYDFQSTDHRIDPAIIQEIEQSATIRFFEETNSYSKVWVYRF
jgi:hypothetical protein